ncbi:MAG: hypothetical protein ACYCVN_00695 [Acidimicrobiales bacterium]
MSGSVASRLVSASASEQDLFGALRGHHRGDERALVTERRFLRRIAKARAPLALPGHPRNLNQPVRHSISITAIPRGH